MDETKAADIIKALAAELLASREHGPVEGDDRPAVAASEAATALLLAAEALESRVRSAARRQAALPRNAGRPWTADEDERLVSAFDSGATIEALATAHERTRAGIEARLVRHERLDERAMRRGHGLRFATRSHPPAEQ